MQVDFQLQTVMLKLPKPVPTRVIAGGVVEYIPGRIIKYDTQGLKYCTTYYGRMVASRKLRPSK